MTINKALLDQIRSALGGSINPNLTTRSAVFDLFEAYVFSFLVEAAKSEPNVNIDYIDTDGKKATTFTFRTSPGQIFNGLYTHAEITFQRKRPLEAHVGVRVSGISKVLHECDVLLLEKNEAEFCRNNNVSPQSSKAILAGECKHCSPRNFGIKLAREFLGLTSDFSKNCKYYFIYNTTSQSVEELLAHHKNGRWFRYVVPDHLTDVDLLKSEFRNTIKNFIATKKYSV
ncbi:hypothetical protein [Anthocerotibacter panamensis]|uniref:hypothetical protein n=1 Tax=Anthocerotibacter panamensis TaxID=2857077 RepID=UPI001C406824|nr:hypothetical protein [Anthocerotibacter panamensis]